MKKRLECTKTLFNVFWYSKTFLIIRITMVLLLFSVIQVMAESSNVNTAERVDVARDRQAQEVVVNGTITDENGEPLPGVNIQIKGTTLGTISDVNGKYTIRVDGPDVTLIYSYVSYERQEILVGNQTVINIMLTPDITALEEIVVIGYGTQAKVNLTGAISVVKGEELVNKPSIGTMDAMQGTISGTVVTRSSGSPGMENFDIQIRGLTSVNGAPALILIDGIEGDMNNVRPEDIESISVLKDAAASAIYGAKAAGGVVLVTTKRGQPGKIKLEYNGYFSMSTVGRTGERISSSRKSAEMRNIADINSGGTAAVSDEILNKYSDPNVLWEEHPSKTNHYVFFGDYDYVDLVSNKYTPMQSHNLALSGGTENTTYRLSGTYFRNDGMLKIGPDNNTKYSGVLNLDTKINKYMSLSNVFSYAHDYVEKPAGSMGLYGVEGRYSYFMYMYTYPGCTPLYDPNGHIAIGETIGTFDSRIKFYHYDDEKGIAKQSNNNMRLNSVLTIENFVEGLKFRVLGAVDANFLTGTDQIKKIFKYGIDETIVGRLYGSNQLKKETRNSAFKEFQFLADYKLETNNHNITVLGGYSFQDFRSEYLRAWSPGQINGDLPSFNWGDITGMTLADNTSTYAFQSLFGRVTYNFKERYLLEGNFRYDGSSKLSPENRYKFFPSASAAWRVSQESWFTPSFINEMKIRGSWGQLGNSGILGNYSYIPLLSRGDNLIFDTAQKNYVYQGSLASEFISWETIETSNIGLDLSFLNNKLQMTYDYFIKRNKDMLARVEYPSVIGVGVPNLNAGEMKTWGWEATVGWRENRGSFNYWISANLSDTKSELVDYLGANVIKEGNNTLLEGYPINSIFGFETADKFFASQEEVDGHAFQNSRTGPGDVKYIDINGDGEISAGRQSEEDHGDLVFLGHTNPRYTFGLQAGFSWKALDFGMLIQGVGKRIFLMDNFSFMPFYRRWCGPQLHHEDYWTEDNQDAFWPRLYTKGDHNYRSSEQWVQNAAYVRLKDIQLGYTLPKNGISKIGVEKLRVYISGRDIFEVTKTLEFIDPEFPNNSTFQYPFRRRLTVGVNVTF